MVAVKVLLSTTKQVGGISIGTGVLSGHLTPRQRKWSLILPSREAESILTLDLFQKQSLLLK